MQSGQVCLTAIFVLLLLLLCQVGREDEFSINRQQMVARILVSMGGTVAEELVFGRDQVGVLGRGV
jgi:ATP-dependent Zn protease